MKNIPKIIILGWIIYVACLFLPAYTRFPGYAAATLAFFVPFAGKHKSILLEIYVFVLSLTNLVMIVSPILIKKVKLGYLRRYRWWLIGSSFLILSWPLVGIVLHSFRKTMHSLGPGYYAWLLSFLLVTIGFWRMAIDNKPDSDLPLKQ